MFFISKLLALIMASNEKYIELRFPFQGINKNLSFSSQPPLTSPQAYNVRPSDVLENRVRGGKRPGLKRQYPTCVGNASPVVAMAEVAIVEVS